MNTLERRSPTVSDQRESAPPRPPDVVEPADTAEMTARFDDSYWDDAFCAWWDPTLRTCCG